jgi:hypothetical protein
VRKLSIFLFIGTLLNLSASFSYAFRPFRTEDAGTAPKRGFAVEIGNEFTDKNEGEVNLTTLALTYGIANWIEAKIDFALICLFPDSDSTEYGFGDMLILSKIKIFGENGVVSQNQKLPEMVIEPSILIPTGDEDKGLGSGDLELGMLLAVEEKFWLPVARANIGYLANNDPTFDRDFEDRFFYGFQLDIPLFHDRLILGSELTGESGRDRGGNPLFSLTGLALEINENLVVDAGLEFGLKDAQSSVTVIVGVTIGFNIFGEEKEFY